MIATNRTVCKKCFIFTNCLQTFNYFDEQKNVFLRKWMCKIFTLKGKGVSARKTEKVNLEISIKYFVKKITAEYNSSIWSN